MADPIENNDLNPNPNENDTIETKLANVQASLSESFEKFDKGFPLSFVNRREGNSSVPNHNSYILINGEPLSALLGNKWRTKHPEDKTSKYRDYLGSSQYQEDTATALREAIQSQKEISLYLPDPNPQINVESKVLFSSGSANEEEIRKKTEQSKKAIDQIAFFDECSRYNQWNVLKEQYYSGWVESKKYDVLNEGQTEISLDHLANITKDSMKISTNRHQMTACAIAEMIRNNHSFEEALDPSKLQEEKKQAGIKVMKEYEAGNKEYFANLVYTYLKKANEYVEEVQKTTDLTNLKQLFSYENRYLPVALDVVNELDNAYEQPGVPEALSPENNKDIIDFNKKIARAGLIERAFAFGRNTACFLAGDQGYRNGEYGTSIITDILGYTKTLEFMKKDELSEKEYYSQCLTSVQNIGSLADSDEPFQSLLSSISPELFAKASMERKGKDILNFKYNPIEAEATDWGKPDRSVTVLTDQISELFTDGEMKNQFLSQIHPCADIDPTVVNHLLSTFSYVSDDSVKSFQIPDEHEASTNATRRFDLANSLNELGDKLVNGMLFVQQKGEEYPRPVQYNNETKAITLGEPVDQVKNPESEKPGRFKSTLNRWFGWFQKDVDSYQAKKADYDKCMSYKRQFDVKLQEAEAKQREAEAKQREAEAKQREAEAKQKELENAKKESERVTFLKGLEDSFKENRVDNLPSVLDSVFEPIESRYSPEDTTVNADKGEFPNRTDYILIDGLPLSQLMSIGVKEKILDTKSSPTQADYNRYLASPEYRKHSEKLILQAINNGCEVEVYAPDRDFQLPKTPLSLSKRDPMPDRILQQKANSLALLNRLAFFDECESNNYNNQKHQFFDEWINERYAQSGKPKIKESVPQAQDRLIASNPLGIALSRDAVTALAFTCMVADEKNYRLEDIFDPTKLTTEKSEIGKKVMNAIEQGDKNTLRKWKFTFHEKTDQYIQKNLNDINPADPNDLYSKKAFLTYSCVQIPWCVEENAKYYNIDDYKKEHNINSSVSNEKFSKELFTTQLIGQLFRDGKQATRYALGNRSYDRKAEGETIKAVIGNHLTMKKLENTQKEKGKIIPQSDAIYIQQYFQKGIRNGDSINSSSFRKNIDAAQFIIASLTNENSFVGEYDVNMDEDTGYGSIIFDEKHLNPSIRRTSAPLAPVKQAKPKLAASLHNPQAQKGANLIGP